MDNSVKYALLIGLQIQNMFDESSENYIDPTEFEESDNIKDFLHALASVVPCKFHNSITGSSMNHLEFNHLANRICFEKMTIDK